MYLYVPSNWSNYKDNLLFTYCYRMFFLVQEIKLQQYGFLLRFLLS